MSAGASRIAVLVALMAMLAPFSIDTYLPSFPDIAAELNASSLQLQQTLSLYLLGFAAMTLVYGPVSDAFGRRQVVLWALLFYALSSIGCALAADIDQLIAFRIGQGVTASAGLVIGRAVVRDAFAGPRTQKVMSRTMLLSALAPAIAPVLGGYLHDIGGWRSVFWFLAALGLGLWLVVFQRFPETLPLSGRSSIHPAAIGRTYFRAFCNARFMALVFAIAMVFGGLFLYISGSPELLFGRLGLGASDFGLLFVPMVAGLMLGAWSSGRLAGRLKSQHTVTLGITLMALAASLNLLLAMSLPVYVLTVIAPVVLYAVGMSLAMPSLSLLVLEHLPRNRGTASAIQGFAQTTFNGLVAGLLVPLLAVSVRDMAVGMLLLVFFGLLLWRWAGRGEAPHPTA